MTPLDARPTRGDEVRDRAWVAELNGLLDLTGWPGGMRVIVRRELSHPGAQLRFDDVDSMQITAFATNTPARRHRHPAARITPEQRLRRHHRPSGPMKDRG